LGKHNSALKSVKIANGQIQSVIKMIEDDRYCVDISNQIQATIALLKKAQSKILSDHLNSCVIESIENENATEKLEEINKIIKVLLKWGNINEKNSKGK